MSAHNDIVGMLNQLLFYSNPGKLFYSKPGNCTFFS